MMLNIINYSYQIAIQLDDLQQSMLNTENQLFEKIMKQNVIQTVEQQMDDQQTMYYDPKLFLFKTTYENESKLSELNVSKEMRYFSAMGKLGLIVNPKYAALFSQQNKIDAADLIQRFLHDTPDLDYFYSVQFKFLNQSFNIYSDFFSFVEENLSIIDTQQFISNTKQNIFQYVINNQKSSVYSLNFTSPIPLQKTSKDVVILISDFSDMDVITNVMFEAATIYDHIWVICLLDSGYVNIIQHMYNRQYLSLQAFVNLKHDIVLEIIQQKTTSIYVQNKQIMQILQQINDANTDERIYLQNNNSKNPSTNHISSEILVFVFGAVNFVGTTTKKIDIEWNLHMFLISNSTEEINQQTLFLGSQNLYSVKYHDYQDFTQNMLPLIVSELAMLYVSTQDEIGVVNETVVMARAIYRDNTYLGMICVQPKIFDTFIDLIMNNFDSLSATTLTIRVNEQRRDLMNPYYQFKQTVDFKRNESLYQLSPIALHLINQIKISDQIKNNLVISTKMVDDDYYIQNYQGYYQKLIQHKEFILHVGLSSTAIAVRTRKQMQTASCQTINLQTNVQPFNIAEYRQITGKQFVPYDQNCILYYQQQCVIKNDSGLNINLKKQIQKQFKYPQTPICITPFQSSKFTLMLGLDKTINEIAQGTALGNFTAAKQEYNLIKQLMLKGDQASIGLLKFKYLTISPNSMKEFSNIETCAMVVQGKTFSSPKLYDSLVNRTTVSPIVLLSAFGVVNEVIHFSQVAKGLEYLLTQQHVDGVYLGHTLKGGDDIDYVNILEQRNFVENQLSSNQEVLMRNKYCLDLARYYTTMYFMFSSNSSNNDIVQKEQLKSNIEGMNSKFRLGFGNQKFFLTKPLISRNKSLVNAPNINGYLTIEINYNIFQDLTQHPYLIMDGTGQIIYSNNTQLNQNQQLLEVAVRQILLDIGYLKEYVQNTTVQSTHKTISMNLRFWDTALNNKQFSLFVNQNLSRFEGLLAEEDYNQSAVYERTIVVNATKSQYFQSGSIYIKEFSVFNEFIIILNDVQHYNIPLDQLLNEQKQQQKLIQQSVPINVTLLDVYYPNITTRSKKIPQVFHRMQQTKSSPLSINVLNNRSDLIHIMFSLSLTVMYLIYKIFRQNKQEFSVQEHFTDYETNIIVNSQSSFIPFFEMNYTEEASNMSMGIRENKLSFAFCPSISHNYVFKENIISYQESIFLVQKIQFRYQIISHLHNLFQDQVQTQVSFILMCPAQQYAIFISKIKSESSNMPKEVTNFSNSTKLIVKNKENIIVMPNRQIVTYLQDKKQKIVTKKMNQINQSYTYEREIINYPRWFDDINDFYSQDNTSVCNVNICKFAQTDRHISNTRVKQLVEQAIAEQ
ncbi:Conserved_hypothetical protein [Hexamita inflata]|uniref:Uncharacterized protein n=1 Tax=Hexamita inflata TaxID=28002 RepID=A0AA86QFF2_9EUKA|nr:Conserved hypothetical protein [Hexamita inflata]